MGKIKSREPAEDKEKEKGKEDEKEGKKAEVRKKDTFAETMIHVVLVADIDMLTDEFFRIREMGESPDVDIHFNFDNVTFILNVLDKLANEERFIEIRKRRPHYRTLTRIEKETQAAQSKTAKAHEKYMEDVKKEEERERKEIEEKVKEFQSRKGEDPLQLIAEAQTVEQNLNRQMDAKMDRFKKRRKRNTRKLKPNPTSPSGYISRFTNCAPWSCRRFRPWWWRFWSSRCAARAVPAKGSPGRGCGEKSRVPRSHGPPWERGKEKKITRSHGPPWERTSPTLRVAEVPTSVELWNCAGDAGASPNGVPTEDRGNEDFISTVMPITHKLL